MPEDYADPESHLDSCRSANPGQPTSGLHRTALWQTERPEKPETARRVVPREPGPAAARQETSSRLRGQQAPRAEWQRSTKARSGQGRPGLTVLKGLQ